MISAIASGRYPAHKRATAAAILLLAGLWLLYLLLWPNPGVSAAGLGIPVGDPAPDFTLTTIDGKTYTLSELRGQAVMLNFFATWCPPCRAEMPMLEETYRELQSQGFTIVAVNLNESNVTISAFQKSLGITFPIVVDKDDQVVRQYDILPLPTSYFVDRDGIVRAKWTGEIGKAQLMTLLKNIL